MQQSMRARWFGNSMKVACRTGGARILAASRNEDR